MRTRSRAQETLARHVDPDTAYLSRDDLAAEIGADAHFGGLAQRRSASLHVGRFAVGLAESAARAGATIHEGAAVTQIDRDAGRPFRIVTTQGAVEARDVLLATGASQHGPFAWQRRRIAPIGSFVIVTESLSQACAPSIMPGRRNCATSQHIGNYCRMTADNRLVFGGRARFARSNPAPDIKSGAILQRTMRRVFPQLADARIAHCWGGLVDMTRDRLPRAGSHEGVHFAMGYSGNGVQMSTCLGDLTGRRLAGEDVADPWRDLDWPAVPLHAAKAWLPPLVGLCYRALDRMG